MSDTFARRVSTFLVMMLLVVVISGQRAHFRRTINTVLDLEPQESVAATVLVKVERRMLTAPSLAPDNVQRIMNGQFSGAH